MSLTKQSAAAAASARQEQSKMENLILASSSARRKEILAHIGLDYTAVTADVDETEGLPDSPAETVTVLAERKARAVAELDKYRGKIVIGSDTVVSHRGKILTKPRDKEDAVRMLKALSGDTHEVYSGLCVTNGSKTVCTYAETTVRMRNITDEEIGLYVKTNEPLDKAGAYGVQDIGGIFVESLTGDYYNVVGLPLEKLCAILKNDFGYDVLKAIKTKV